MMSSTIRAVSTLAIAVVAIALFAMTGCAEGTLDTELADTSRGFIVSNLPPANEAEIAVAPPRNPPRAITISLAGLQLEADTPEGRARTHGYGMYEYPVVGYGGYGYGDYGNSYR